MDSSTAVAFCYPKAAGLLSKAFIKDRTHLLFEQESLADLWTLLFKEQSPLVPEAILAQQIEEKAFETFLLQYIFFLNQYDKPPLILTDKIKRFEAENLKEIIDALCSQEKECPHLLDLKDFSTIDTKTWPVLSKMTAQTDFSWLKEIPPREDQQSVEFKMDMQLLRENWDAIERCHGANREGHERLFLDEFIIKNIVWALRLKLFYGMEKDEIIQNLFYVTDSPDKNDPVAAPAIKMLDFDVNKYSDWSGWKYEQYLNPNEPASVWSVDPVWIERKYIAHQVVFADRIFHEYSMEDAALAAWFKIKSYELTCIRTAVECLRLNIGSNEAMEAIGINA